MQFDERATEQFEPKQKRIQQYVMGRQLELMRARRDSQRRQAE